MPNLGDEVKGIETDKEYRPRGIFIWWQCPKCKKEYWKSKYDLKKSTTGGLCIHCVSNHIEGIPTNSWKGGIHRTRGYILLRIYPSDPFYFMADGNGYVPEHRLVMAKHLGRCLLSKEIVHHLNGIKDDNGKENLQLVTREKHGMSYTDGYRQALREEISFLDGILHMPFFEFCLQVKERKQRIIKEVGDAKV